ILAMEWRTSLEKAMSVQITPKSTQHTGMAISTEGSVAAWQVTFQLDGDESLHAAISVSVAGPSTHQEAQQKALKLLQVFLSDACEAAKSTNFQIRTLPRVGHCSQGAHPHLHRDMTSVRVARMDAFGTCASSRL